MDRFEFSAFQQECLQDGVISYRVQAKKAELTLHALLILPTYDKPTESSHVIQRRQQLVNIAQALIGEKGGGYLPAIIESGQRLQKLAPQFSLNEPYILLEQPLGVFLATIFEPISQEDAATIILRVAHGVEALHDSGWIHGSLAPEKIYVSLDRALGTLGHFGTVMLEVKGKIIVTEHLLKNQNENFSPPEIQTQKKVNKTIDIYALGLLLYRLLVGCSPPPITKTSILSRLVNSIFKVENSFNSRFPKIKTIPKKLAEVIEKATALEPKNRYSQVSEFIQAVGNAVGWSTAKFSPAKPIPKGLLSEGYMLGGYKIKGVFASGNQGIIYDAWKLPCGTNTGFPNIPVLIKCTQYNYQETQDVGLYILGKRIQIKHEATMLQRLHRSLGRIPQLIDFFYDQTHDPVIKARAPSMLNNEPYMVISKIAAYSLGNIDQAEQNFAIRIGRRLAETLVAIHARQVLYQDIKPENILVDPWGSTVFLVDLGAVCPVINGKLQENSPGYGNVTPGYQGPEFDELWQNTDYRFDIYSLGATLFFLLTGICPLYDLYVPKFNSIEKKRKNLGTDTLKEYIRNAERPILDLDKLPISVRPVIAQLIERNRNKRCQDAQTAVKILKNLERQLLGYPIQAPSILRFEAVEFECQISQDIAITHIVLNRIIGNKQTTVARLHKSKTIILRDPEPVPGIILYKIQTETAFNNITCLATSKEITYAPPLTVTLIEKPGAILIRWIPIVSAKNYVILRHNRFLPKNLKEGIQIGGNIKENCFIEDKTVSPNKTYFYAVIAQYPNNLYSPATGGAATPRPLPVMPEFIDWTSNLENSHCLIQWKQADPLPDYYIIRELNTAQKELGTFEFKATSKFRYTVETCPGEKRWIHIASRIMDVYSAWDVKLVVAYVSVTNLHAEPAQAERAVLIWETVPGVFYQIERKTDEYWQKIAQCESSPFCDENLVPGEYHYRIQALVPLNTNEYEYLGSAKLKIRVLEAVPLPDVQVKLQDNLLNLSWYPSMVQILCETKQETLYSGQFEQSDNLKLKLPIGIPVTIQVWGIRGEQISQHPFRQMIIATAPIKALNVDVFIEQTKIYWKIPQNTSYCIIFRQTEMGTTTVCERCHKNFFIDTGVPTDIKLNYKVKPVFQNSVMGNAKMTSTICVPPEPQVPQNLHWVQEDKNICFKWQLPPYMRYISAWQVIICYNNVEKKHEIARNTTFITLKQLPPWLPIDIQVRAIVGTQTGHKVARCVGGVIENLNVTINAAINQVNLQWDPPPLMGQLLVKRVGRKKTVHFSIPANKNSFVDFPSEMDIEYIYTYYFELKHPKIGILTTSSFSQKAFPRSYPLNTEGATVELQPDGQHVHLTWPAELKIPSVDYYLYLRKIGTQDFSNTSQLGLKELKPPHSDYIPQLGLRCQYARMAINSLATQISPVVSVTSIPQSRIESIQGERQIVIFIKKLSVWQVLLRKHSSEKIQTKLKVESIKVLLENLQLEGEGIQLLAPGLTKFFDISTDKTFHYHLFSLVIKEGKCFISEPPQYVPVQKGRQVLASHFSLWVAKQWFQINHYLITTKILDFHETELPVQVLRQGKIKVLIPGDGYLLFIPKSYKKRPMVQVFRTRPWRLRQRVINIYCDEEPWLNISGNTMTKILESF